MAAGPTFEPIATTTLGAAAASYTFSSISQSYTDLVIVTNVATATSENMFMRFNGDTTGIYSRTILAGNGSVVTSARNSNFSQIYCNYYSKSTSNFDDTKIIQIQNYSNTTTFKSCLIRGGAAGGGTAAIVGLWRNTAAITSVVLVADGANFSTGSTFTLYGIASA